MKNLKFRYGCAFGGSGLGGRGVQEASIRLETLGVSASFECVGSFDYDARACLDYEYLNESPQSCSDVRAMTVADVHRIYGVRAPHMILMSPPCTGASSLLSAAKGKTQKYQDMNELGLVWLKLMLSAWDDPPALILFENVPRLPTRAPEMLNRVRKLLHRAGYVLHESNFDCGPLGGLAQHRRRFLLVARRPAKCASFLYQPPALRVRGCGEVLSQLPVPGTDAARAWGRMHELPKLSEKNWQRLALIPAGGDWRDLEGVLAENQARRELFKRHAVEQWGEPTGTIGGGGSNGVENVADPRVKYAYDAGYGVLGWNQPARTIAGQSAVGCGAYSVADLRVNCSPRAGAYGVVAWDAPSKTVVGSMNVDNAPASIADPRGAPVNVPVIIAADGTWHRPLTTFELAALQDFPLVVRGEPLLLREFTHSSARTRIGNAIPRRSMTRIAEKMLIALTESAMGAFSLSSDSVWVAPEVVQ